MVGSALVALSLVAVLASCSSPSPTPAPTTARTSVPPSDPSDAPPAPPPSPAPQGSAATTPPPAPAPTPGLITDDECVARGGKIVTEQTYAHLRHSRPPNEPVIPFRICRFPSSKNGAACRDDSECDRGRCFCTGALARPNPSDDPKLRALDRTTATGRCSDEPLPDGAWFCLVEGGTVHLDGIIVD